MRPPPRAFSLVELLMVVAVIALLTGLGAAGLAGAARSGKTDFVVEQVRRQLDLARQTATAMNTYCYVALGRSGEDLWVATLQSLDGTPAAGSGPETVSPGVNNAFLSRVERTRNVVVEDDLPAVDRTAFRDLPDAAHLDAALQPGDAMPQFSIPLPGAAGTVTSTHVIEFSPAGEATVRTAATGPAGAVRLVLVPSAGASPGESERAGAALLWIHGASGHTEIYQR